MPAALKRRPRPEPAATPTVPDARAALAGAIEHKRECDDAVARQHEAIRRSQQLLTEAEQHIEKLRSRIAVADLTDTRRAASLIKAERPIQAAWVGENARSAVERAEKNLQLTIKGRATRQAELAELELAAKVAENAVIVERIKLVAPIAAKTLERLKALRMETAQAVALLDALVHDHHPDFTADQIVQAKTCEELRRAAFAEVRSEAASFAIRGQTIEEFELAKQVTAKWNAKLAALLADANAEI